MTGPRRRPTAPGIQSDLREEQVEFFEEYFRKGAEFTRALLEENEKLRERLVALEERAREAAATGRVDLEREYHKIETDHHDLSCLFVTQSQLSRARDATEVVGVIAEVLLNFIGADRFALYVADGAGFPRPIFTSAIDRGELDGDPPEAVSAAAGSGLVAFGDLEAREISEPPAAAFPLTGPDGCFGAIAIWSYLGQKTELANIDRRLFEVVGAAGGAALEAARLRGQGPRLAPPDRFRALSLLLGL
jgi:hypothetical protein